MSCPKTPLSEQIPTTSSRDFLDGLTDIAYILNLQRHHILAMVEAVEIVYIQRYSFPQTCNRYTREDLIGVIKEELQKMGEAHDGGENVVEEEGRDLRKIDQRALRLKERLKSWVDQRLKTATGLEDTLPEGRREGRKLIM